MQAPTYTFLRNNGNLLLLLRNSQRVRRNFLVGRKSEKIVLMEIATAFTIIHANGHLAFKIYRLRHVTVPVQAEE